MSEGGGIALDLREAQQPTEIHAPHEGHQDDDDNEGADTRARDRWPLLRHAPPVARARLVVRETARLALGSRQAPVMGRRAILDNSITVDFVRAAGTAAPPLSLYKVRE